MAELPKRKEIVAYCRGPYCLMSYDAVQLLRTKGLKARRLEEGLPEWRLAGLPTVIDRRPEGVPGEKTECGVSAHH